MTQPPPTPFRWSLADRKLSLSIVLASALIVGALWLFALQRIAFEREQAVTAALRSNANLAIAYEEQVFQTLKAAEQVAAFVREEYLRDGPDIPLRRWVERGVIREERFTVINVVNAAGGVAASSSTSPRIGTTNYADRPFFLAQREARDDRLFVNPPVLGRVSGLRRIPMSLRITRADGGFGGVVVMAMDPARLAGANQRNGLGNAVLLELTGLDGVVRARNAGDISSLDDARALPWFQRQRQAAHGSFVDDGGTDGGTARIISYRTLQGYPLMVTVGAPLADTMGPLQQRHARYRTVAGCATAVLLAFAALLLWVLADQRRVARALQASEARLAHDARHDALTGLPNRVLFQNRFDQVLDSARRHGRHAAVLYLDLDGFKPVNDRHGHATGDLLLRQVAQRLQASVRGEDTVSRFGGDEFGIVLAEVAQPRDCEQVAAKVLAALAQPFTLEDGVTAHISASVGAALFPDHGHDMTTLVAHADTAMYAAKNAGKNRFSWG
ncbi:MAG: sensor domain-containing diguanylate cyclase [Acidovorax sp.]